MKTLTTTPKQDGFYMPGEFDEHEGCFMVWPQRSDNWRNGGKPAQQAFAEVAKAIAQFEPVTMMVNHDQYHHARYLLPDSIRVLEASSNDAWMRDIGPSFVTNGKTVRGIDWRFNAWGGLVDGLYFPWDKDDAMAQKVCEIAGKDRYRLNDFVLEGGSIHVDGEGTVLVTEECLLSKGRNPQLSKSAIENILKDYLNVEKIIWIKDGIYLDETNGHVDNICCYVKPGEVMLAWCEDKADPQYAISKAAYDLLTKETDAKGRKLKIHKIHVPKPITIREEESVGVDAGEDTLPRLAGDRLAASYANFYIANGGIVYPTFGDPMDQEAQKVLEAAFPNRKVVGVYAREILLGGGNIHCITQQLPKSCM